ncbi:hypothetical protein CAter282_0020 [Collimonas arenae]|uniref:Uncharacterized protein n=1 Tax=Collimonas arenae TaxID=279058 RepID=A0A127QCU5_9BURK|nr:hypothetical protein CAter282_0020 [Collimonas arenae]
MSYFAFKILFYAFVPILTPNTGLKNDSCLVSNGECNYENFNKK